MGEPDRVLDELCEKYPQIPRSIILKTDLLTRGVAPSDDLKGVGDDGLSDTMRGFKFHHDVVTEKTDTREQVPVLLPYCFHFRDQTFVKIITDFSSPYTIRCHEGGRFFLQRGDEALEEVFFPPKPSWMKDRLSDGTPVSNVLFEVSACHLTGIVPLDYCEYFRDGNQCLCCDWNPTFELAKKAGFRTRIATDTAQLVEAYERAYGQPGSLRCDHAEVVITGSFLDRGKEAEVYLRTARALKETPAGRSHDFLLASQALDEEDARACKEAGYTYATWNIEQWDERMFNALCPGKARHVGHARWRELLLKGVEIFGVGYFSTNFVVGPELVLPNGFASEDEALESLQEAFQWCLDHGIYPFYTFWWPSPGSILAERNCFKPRTEFNLRVSLENHRLLEKYHFNEITHPRKRASCHRCGLYYLNYDYPRLIDPVEGPRWFEWKMPERSQPCHG